MPACENFSCYEKGLDKALRIINDALRSEGEEEEAETSNHPLLSDPNFAKLNKIAAMDRRINKVLQTF